MEVGTSYCSRKQVVDVQAGKIHLYGYTHTATQHRSESANGQLRSLTLSVQDHVTILEGRKMGRKPKDSRWVDALEVPGQFLGLREGVEAPDADAQPTKLFAIASSPYDAKRNSAMLDAALVEVLVDRAGDEMEARLSQLAPGSVVHVTQVVGSGYVVGMLLMLLSIILLILYQHFIILYDVQVWHIV